MRHQHKLPTYLLAMAVAVPLDLSVANNGLAQSRSPLDRVINQLDQIETELDDVSDQLDQIGTIGDQLADRYVPFAVENFGGLCNSAAAPSANPEILINSDGTAPFVVTSILIKRGFLDPVDFMFLSVNTVTIDDTSFDTRTTNIFFDTSQTQTAVFHSADIMGMPVRLNTSVDAPHEPGGNVPNQIVANIHEAFDDIKVRLFCRSDNQDFEIQAIRVGGWKQPEDTISVDYVPGD